MDFLSAEEALKLTDGELVVEEERVWPQEKQEVGVAVKMEEEKEVEQGGKEVGEEIRQSQDVTGEGYRESTADTPLK